MNNTEIFNIMQNAISGVEIKNISINNISSYTSIDNTCGIKFSATKSGITESLFFGFSNDPKYMDYLVFGILNSECNKNLNMIFLNEDNSKNLILEKFKFDKKFLLKDESFQIKKLSKWLKDEIESFFILLKMFNKELFRNEIETSEKNENSVNKKEREVSKSHKTKKKEKKEKIESYDNISTGTWFKIVELPWLIILLSFFELCGPSLSETPPTDSEFNTALVIFYIIFSIGLIGVLATIGKKKKIREAQGLSITMNPYSWFISKIGKVICGTLFFVLGFGLLFLLSSFKDTVFSSSGTSGSSGSRSSSSSSSSSHSSSSTRTSGSSITYYCKYCGARANSIQNLTFGSCPKHPNGLNKGNHSPYQGPEQKYYYCEYCGARANSIGNLTFGSCPKHPNGLNKGNHSPYQGSEKSQYFCKYCGARASSIANLTFGSCPKHPNGLNKGNHSPSL